MSRVTAAVAVLALLSPVVVGAPSASAIEEDYGSRVTMTRGEHVAAQLPITLKLPAPADGTALTEVFANWYEQVPQTGAEVFRSMRIDASHCLPEVDCEVDGVLPTAGMLGNKPIVNFGVRSGETTVGRFRRTVTIENPKPTVSMTSPENFDAVWETFTITADAAPSTDPGAAPLKGVRFYLDTENRYSQGTGYRFDDTAPYAVTVPVDDLQAPVLGQPKIAVVAEDVYGRLSTYPESGAYPLMTRRVTVGPPPELSWTATPPAPPEAGGSTSGGVEFEYDARLPDSVPTREFYNPHLRTVEHLVDGQVVHSYRPDGEPRAVAGTPWFLPASVTGGVHTFTIRVTTDYRSVAEISADVLVSDGVELTGPVTSGRRVVRNGFVVTAGDVLRFRVPVATKVDGTHLDSVDIRVGNQGLFHRFPFCAEGTTDCPEAATVLTNHWGAPDEPGRATLSIQAAANGDARATTINRAIKVQPAAKLVARVSRHRLRIGRAVRVTGVLRRADNGAPQAGRTVRIQWRRLGTNRWTTLATRTTNDDGRVAARFKPRRTGFYRLRSPEVRGTLGPGISNEPKVRVLRR